MDLIINNTNETASIYENKQSETEHYHSVQIQLQDTTQNVNAIGATVRLFTPSGMQQQTVFPARGFQSSSTFFLHFGLGQQSQIDSVQVWWPEGNLSVYKKVQADTINKIMPQQGLASFTGDKTTGTLFTLAPNNAGINYVHQSDGFVDFKRLMGLPHQISRQGPFMAVDDVNGDKLDDIFVGGNDLQPGKLFIQNGNGSFRIAPVQPWQQSRVPDGGVCFFDADADGDNDLYVAHHGMQLNENDFAYQHQLYLNDGKGNFSFAIDALPEMRVSSTTVTAADYNKDGKTDLLVACRSVPGRFPVIPTTYLLRNVSGGSQVKFEYASEQQSQLLRQPGLVTCAVWADINKDTWPDLLVAGEYMPITLFINERGQLKETKDKGFDNSNGWWCRLAVDDLDNDGDLDLVGGNAGLNMQMKASPEQPVALYYNDFDRNGLIDPVLTYYIGGRQVPALGLDDMAEETPVVRKKFIRYEQFAKATWNDLYDEESRKDMLELKAFEMQSCWWENNGKGQFTKHVLPLEAQFSMLQGMVIMDVDKDGKKDLVVAGNYYPWRTQWGRMDASYGWVLRNTGKAFVSMYPSTTGLWLGGDLRDLQMIRTKGQPLLAATRYEGPLSVAQLR
ncbi:MAG TPA: FG-GAP-like repeat-containing protein [Phnomibacter sp.]|nr:FG-GAP-like repeat-containing protein [Phnomibacter sp.]